MSQPDVVIRGGLVVDGTGAPGQIADVAISDGRIQTIGEITETGVQEIDASGLVIAPGFIDIHTHYDAQVFWDGMLSPSPFHGVTTVVAGNCGFSIAPLTPEAGEYLLPMLARVEGMPVESLRAGVPWDWRSFGEYLGRHEGRLGINAGFMVGHSALRRVVMGERAVGHEATEAEIAAMAALLEVSLSEGGFGFSSSVSISHNDASGQPVPSRHAGREEFLALGRVLHQFPGTALEMVAGNEPFSQEQIELMTELSLAANRPLNWNSLNIHEHNADFVKGKLAASDYAKERGARLVALTIPSSTTLRVNFVSGAVFDQLPGWNTLFQMSLKERKATLADPVTRKKYEDLAAIGLKGQLSALSNWDRVIIAETFAPQNARFTGRSCGDVAAEFGKSSFDTMIDIVLADDLRTSLQPMIDGMGEGSRADWEAKARMWTDERVMIGASDAGAHLDMVDTFAIPTRVLANAVRKHGVIALEELVHQLTDRPARLYGLRERGRLEPGWHADVVVFDPATVDCGPVHTREDLPGGAGRLYAEGLGIAYVFVNGVEIVRGTQATGKRPGTVLHSNRDTYTVGLQTA